VANTSAFCGRSCDSVFSKEAFRSDLHSSNQGSPRLKKLSRHYSTVLLIASIHTIHVSRIKERNFTLYLARSMFLHPGMHGINWISCDFLLSKTALVMDAIIYFAFGNRPQYK
jgi:hypothetical protein